MKPQDSRPSGPGASADDGVLTFRRERFCRAFVRHGNAARAAREAGYADRSAKHRGHRLLALAPVRARIGVLAAEADDGGAGETHVIKARLDMLFEQALDAGAFHAAARAVELQARHAAALPAPAPAADDEPDLDVLIARAEAEIGEIDFGGGEEDGDDRG